MNIKKLFLATLVGISFIGCNLSIGASGDEEGPWRLDDLDEVTSEQSECELHKRFHELRKHPELLGKFFEETKTGPRAYLGEWPNTATLFQETALYCLGDIEYFRLLAEMLKFVDPQDKDLIRMEERYREKCNDCIENKEGNVDFCIRMHGVHNLLSERIKQHKPKKGFFSSLINK